MPLLLTALLLVAFPAAASGQGFIGVDDDPQLGKADAKVTIKAEVQKDYKDGADIGMKGTPVFFINGRAIVGAQPSSTFQTFIEEELRK